MTRPRRGGRPPKPLEAKVLEGTARKADREKACERSGLRAVGQPTQPLTPPPELSAVPEALEEWKRVRAWLDERGALESCDAGVLAAYAMSVGRWRQAEAVVNAEGAFYTTPGGIVRKHPAVGVASDERKHLRALAGLLGVTPADRERVPAKPPEQPWGKKVYPRGMEPKR